MRLMLGSNPFVRTLKHLKSGKIALNDKVRIFSIAFNEKFKHHEGAKDFVFWILPQIQYKNPTVQCITLEALTPSTFIKVYFEDYDSLVIDLDSRSKDEIINHLLKLPAVTKTKEEMLIDQKSSGKINNPSHFGHGCERHCLCEEFGQVPCSSAVLIPYHWRGIPEKEPAIEVPFYIQKLIKDQKKDV